MRVQPATVALLLLAGRVATGPLEPRAAPALRESGTRREILLADACSPGMSCFGHMVVLPNGEVVEAVAAATAAAAMVAPASDTPTNAASKAKPDPGEAKASAKPKAEVKAQPVAAKAKPCIPEGGVKGPGRFKTYRGPGVWILCRYKCGKDEVFRPFNPGIEADCWNSIPTYTE